jgi:3-dehydroquinate dehydratase-2
VITGPNLNMLGKRETDIYGSTTLEEIHVELLKLGKTLGLDVIVFQSNHEGELLDEIQKAAHNGIDGILINPGAYGHTSIALRDALLAVQKPFVEVHISNIYERESFRQTSYLSDIASGVVIGFGVESYMLGLRGLSKLILGAM